jgi:hypothetical protein
MDDPKSRTNKRQMPDTAAWFILNHPNASAQTLSELLNVSERTIISARHRWRYHGWSCRIDYVPCAKCGKIVTVGGHIRRDRVYHPSCRTEVRQSLQKRYSEDFWERADEPVRRAKLARVHSYDRKAQEITSAHATKSGKRWSEEDDEVLANADAANTAELALALGRTLYAVKDRLQVLRKRQRNHTLTH